MIKQLFLLAFAWWKLLGKTLSTISQARDRSDFQICNLVFNSEIGLEKRRKLSFMPKEKFESREVLIRTPSYQENTQILLRNSAKLPLSVMRICDCQILFCQKSFQKKDQNWVSCLKKNLSCGNWSRVHPFVRKTSGTFWEIQLSCHYRLCGSGQGIIDWYFIFNF